MWRAVLRSMYSSGLTPLTSPAILQSKIVVSKCVILPIPETPSTMLDHTVSMSFPIGVMKPMPVTATRRALELDVMPPAYGREGQFALAPSGKTELQAWTLCPNLYLKPHLRGACGSPVRIAGAGVSQVSRGPPPAPRGVCGAGKALCGGAARGRPPPP